MHKNNNYLDFCRLILPCFGFLVRSKALVRLIKGGLTNQYRRLLLNRAPNSRTGQSFQAYLHQWITLPNISRCANEWRKSLKLSFSLWLISFLSVSAVMANTPLIKIKAGSFTPLYGTYKKPVKIKSFYLDETPVTNQEFLDFIKTHPEWSKTQAKKLFIDTTYLTHWKGDLELGPKAPAESPVVNVSWYAAKAYCVSQGKRLPTVNEWEYVASRKIPGHDIKKIILDWYSIPTPEILPSVTVGLKNSTGVSSMHGLIWEWTLDFNSTMVTGESRADGSLDKTLFCGSGSANAADKTDYAAFMRFGFRSSLKANYTIANLGFRCAKESQ